jgi:hypothetical protein
MLVIILAVTKAYDRFCIAGLNEDGQWVRPMPAEPSAVYPQTRFWTREQLLMNNGKFVMSGDVWDIDGRQPGQFLHPNHIEDYVVTRRTFARSLSNNQLMEFLRLHAEDANAFNDTVMGRGRSLCLVELSAFRTEVFYGDPKIYLSGNSFNLDNPHVNFKNYKIKDCKWAGLIMQGYQYPSFNEMYACIGLATQWGGTEYPQLIGLHTMPEAPYLSSYPD